jgi:hypothetical protein
MRTIDTATDAAAWVAEQAIYAGPWGFDTETEGLDPRKQPAAGDHGRIVCFTVATPVRVSGDELEADGAFFWANDEVLSVLGPWWESAPVVGHNLYGFDAHMCRRAGYELGNIRMDTLRAHRLIDTGPDVEHGLKALMHSWLGIEPVGKLTELFSRKRCLEVTTAGEMKYTWRKVDDSNPRVPTLIGGPTSRFGEMSELVPLSAIRTEYPHLLEALYQYALLDAVATLKLWWKFQRRMAATKWVQFV